MQTPLEHSDLKSISLPFAESISVKILDAYGDFRVHALYISPAASRLQAKQFFDLVFHSSEPAMFIGDFNAKHHAWNNAKTCLKGLDIYNLCNLRRFTIHSPDSPTNFPPTGDPSVLDFVISNKISGISKLNTCNELSSDHIPISFDMTSNFSTPPEKKIPNFRKANWRFFRDKLDDSISHINNEHPTLNSCEDIDMCIEKITNSINTASASAIPLKKPYKFRYPTSKLLQILTRERNHYRNLYRHTLDSDHKSMMNMLNREIRKHIVSLNSDSFEKRISELNTADNSIFSFTKALKMKKHAIPPLTSNSSTAYSEQEKAVKIAESFLNAHNTTVKNFSKHAIRVLRAVKKVNMFKPLNSDNSRESNKFSVAKISEIISQLKVRKACGSDQVTNRVIKNLSRAAIVLLTKIFNSCWLFCYFPTKWKIAKILPFPKPGKDLSVPASYRPISLLSCLGKLFEKLILDLLADFEDNNKIVIVQQFGFRKEHSTVHQILRITEKVSKGFNKNRSTAMVLLDLEKAFDSVWHDGLIFKLLNSNYPMRLVKIVQSYLTCRKAFVQVGTSSSTSFELPAGVPQGSLLSPHLFNIFINDVPLPKNGEVAMYADDTAIYCDVSWKNASRAKKILENGLNDVHTFFTNWKIKLNKEKTEFITFTKSFSMRKKLDQFKPVFEGNTFEWKPTVRYLGVLLDQGLSFGEHIHNSINKAKGVMKILFPLIRRNSAVDKNMKITIYRSFIRPILVYACPIFTNCPKCYFKKLQLLQNKCLRMALDSDWYTRNTSIHEESNMPTIREHVNKLTESFYLRSGNHDNSIIRALGQYNKNNVSFRVKHRLPKAL